MTRSLLFLVLTTLLAAPLLLPGCNKSESGKPAASGKPSPGKPDDLTPLRIAVVPKGTSHDYWKSVHAGALQAEKEAGNVVVTFRGPEREDDREQQVALVQNLVSAGYNAIVLAPLDETALVGPVRQATAAKIPVVIIDSGLKAQVGTDFATFVATDNYKGGLLAGEEMVRLLAGKGKVLLLRYTEGSASTNLREQGFVDAIANQKNITLVDPKRYAGVTRATAQEAAENLLAANGDIDGIFCPNESSAFGMLLALRSRGLASKVKFIGFDSSQQLVEALRTGEISALVVQNPVKMGRSGVQAAIDCIKGRKVESRIDTGVGIVTAENMNTPENKELLSPDLSILSGTR